MSGHQPLSRWATQSLSSSFGEELISFEENDAKIRLKFVGQEEAWGRNCVQHIQLPWDATMGLAKQDFAQRVGVLVRTLRFISPDAIPVEDSHTPKELRLLNGSQIDVFVIRQESA